MSVRKHRKIGGRYHWSNCLLFDYEFLLRWMTAGYSSLTDHVQFLEDNRVYTTHLYGNGRPLDNNAFLLLDITGLKRPSAEVTVKGWSESYKTEIAEADAEEAGGSEN